MTLFCPFQKTVKPKLVLKTRLPPFISIWIPLASTNGAVLETPFIVNGITLENAPDFLNNLYWFPFKLISTYLIYATFGLLGPFSCLCLTLNAVKDAGLNNEQLIILKINIIKSECKNYYFFYTSALLKQSVVIASYLHLPIKWNTDPSNELQCGSPEQL